MKRKTDGERRAESGEIAADNEQQPIVDEMKHSPTAALRPPTAEELLNTAAIQKKTPPVNPLTLHQSFTDKWKTKIKSLFTSSPQIGINMELRDGMHTTFVVGLDDVRFIYRGGSYVVDDELKYYHKGMQLWCLDYHQDFALPIRRKIPLTAIQKGIERSGITEVEHATNPIILERFIISKIAEGIMKGQAIDEYLKALKMLIIIICVVSVLTFLIVFGTSGMLDALTKR